MPLAFKWHRIISQHCIYCSRIYKMEAAGKVATMGFNFSALKEPRGFIKIIQFVLSIFAFATTTSFSSSTTFRVKCVNATEKESLVTFSYGYPMDLESVCIKLPVCSGATTTTGLDKFCLLAGAKPAAEFYVFVGVIVMLYSLAALVIYIFFDELYRKNNRLIIVDFVVSVILALLWLISSSAWASGLSHVKEYTDPLEGGIYSSKFPECSVAGSCTTVNVGNYGSLNASIIFGFLNMMVWLGNLWFLYKETPWFKIQSKPPSAPEQSQGGANVY